MFAYAYDFNGDVSAWDTSAVTDMRSSAWPRPAPLAWWLRARAPR
eukprot:COSAG01_NODE_49719_length_369_cov_2.159259_1_plen_44_part_10